MRETNLERLCIPIPHSLDGGHFVQAIGKVAEFLHAVCQPDGELFGEELGGAEEGSYRWFLAELHHLPQRDTCMTVRHVTVRGDHGYVPVAGKLL